MKRLLIIASRAGPSQYRYLKHAFEKEYIDVILDRRVGARRQRQEGTGPVRRGKDRRQRDIVKDLQTFGWAVVRR
ncbi:MAG: hypothetical protein DMD97_26110 [Candidatus Rokuibacteriota bacterium]|nr:MAG: hypothetical protein DMD97_26110 [Candidatus Rokubacteria bacterium]